MAMKYERITKPIDEDNFGGLSKIEVTRKLYRAYSKLVKHEDIEEELGIEFVTLFKALMYGIYDKEYDRHVIPFLTWHEYFDQLVLFYEDYDDDHLNNYYLFKDYGVTWALTKEELK